MLNLTDREKFIKDAYRDLGLFEKLFPEHFFYKSGEFHKEWDKIFGDKRDNKRIVLIAPRGHAKTTHIAVKWTLHDIAYREEKFIVIISETEDQAILILKDILSILDDNEEFCDLYGLRVEQRSAKSIVVNGIKIVAKGSGQKIRGVKHKESRPTKIICDDIQSEEIAYSKDARKKLKGWFFGTAIPALDKENGKAWVVGTILHDDDILNTLYNNSAWKHFKFQITRNGRLDGEPLWRERFTKVDVMKLYKEFEEAGELEKFYTEFMSVPMSDEMKKFRPEYIKFFDTKLITDRVKYGEMRTFIAVDLNARWEETKNDKAVIMTVALDEASNFYVIDVKAGHFDPMETYENIELAHQEMNWNILVTGVESYAYQYTFRFWAEREQQRKGLHMNIEQLQLPNKRKDLKIYALLPMFRRGTIFFPDKKPLWFYEFLEEYDNYPKVKHDDYLDALSMIPTLAQSYGVTYRATKQEVLDDFVNPYRVI